MSNEKPCVNCSTPTTTENYRHEPYCSTCQRAFLAGHAAGEGEAVERIAKGLDRPTEDVARLLR